MLFFNSPDSRKKELARWGHKFKIESLLNYQAYDQITKLDCANKQIDKLPKQIDCLTNLEVINLEYNGLADLPWEFRNLKNLKSVNFGYNKFQELPGVICQLENLEHLNFEANQLKKINGTIANLKKLTDLNLFANRIVELPAEIGSLSHLTRLNLALNQLTTLPASFAKLYNVVMLELWLNKFEQVPDVISKLPNLKDLLHVVESDQLNLTLLWAVIGNNESMAEKLIAFGADVNYTHEDTETKMVTTPLFEAKSIDMINLLLNKGADLNAKREIVKTVVTKDKEEVRATGTFETFLTRKHPKEIQKFLKAYTSKEPEKKAEHGHGHKH